MSDQIQVKEKTDNLQVSSAEQRAVETCQLARTSKGSRLKGPLGMAICCGAPLLLVGAIALFGLSLGAVASGLLSVAAVLACPVGMYLMMRMMMKNKK